MEPFDDAYAQVRHDATMVEAIARHINERNQHMQRANTNNTEALARVAESDRRLLRWLNNGGDKGDAEYAIFCHLRQTAATLISSGEGVLMYQGPDLLGQLPD